MSKRCPACGYQNTLTERQALYQYKKAFGTMPVMAMMKRGWLRCGFTDKRGWPSVEEVRHALDKFFDIDKTVWGLHVCTIDWPEQEQKSE